MLLVLVVAVPFALLIYRAAEEDRAHAHAQLSAQAEQLARVVASQHARSITSLRHLLAAAAAEWGGALLGADCERRLQRLLVATPATSLTVAGPDGTLLCSTIPGAAGHRIDDREYFAQALRTREPAVSNLLRGKIRGRHVVVAAHPVLRANGAVESVLVAGVEFDWLPGALAEVGAPQDFEALIIAGKGGTVARFPGSASAARGAGLVMGNARLDGPPEAPDEVHVGLPILRAEDAGNSMLRRGFAVLGSVSAFALLVAWFGSGLFVVQPLRRLTQAAARLDAGDMTARTGVPHREHEIGKLAHQLDALAAHRQRTTRALRALSAGNRTLLREQTEPELLQAMCRVAVEHGGYALAVVYYAADNEDRSVVPAAHAGDDRGALDALRLTWEDNERGQGTVGTAIRSGRTTVFQSIASAPGAAPWREDLLKRGFGSVASMPLKVGDRVIGTFTLFAAETDAFDREELDLVQEMADDLAFGVATCRDRITRIDAEREARRIATHDGLTDLANRSHFIARLGPALAGCAAKGEPLAVVVVHVRNLPALLDGLGYAPGMEVLREIAQRLGALVPEEDVLARVPQDDFVILRRGADAAAVEALAHALLGVFAAPVAVGGAEIDVQGHAGASLYPGHGDEPDLLLRRATIASRDAAMHDAAFALYAGATERENPERLALAAELRRAIAARAMQLHYQPKFDLASGRVVGSEALLRWQHPGRGNVPPGQFVPLAEQTGLIRPLTYMVIDSALRQQRAWLDAGLRLPVAVNLSARNLYDPQLRERIEGLLATWGVTGELLQIEITEGALVADPGTARRVLEGLRALGCRTYIDDFGTGYSSLSYLVSLPVHALKIDRSFVVQMTANQEAHTVVSSIISMAHGLGLRVVAEGVEREEERSALVALGCDEAQGYLLGRPVAAEAFKASFG
jgi:diguanylate cyclase (GGDEF)-like protein